MIFIIEYYPPMHPDGLNPCSRWTAVMGDEEETILNYDEHLSLLTENINKEYPTHMITICPQGCDQ